MSEQQPLFGKRVARRSPPPAVSRSEPTTAYLELAAAARATFRERGAPDLESPGFRPAAADFAEDADMAAYIGSNWRAYRPLWLKMKTAPGMRPGRSISAALFTSLWLLYRKQYPLGAAILAAQIAMTWTALDWSPVFDIVVAVFFGRYGKSIVLLKGISTVEGIRAAGLEPEIALIRIGGAGGGNFVAAILGALLLTGAYWVLPSRETGPTIDAFEGLRVLNEQFRSPSPPN